jgi:hypothetical protein
MVRDVAPSGMKLPGEMKTKIVFVLGYMRDYLLYVS